MHEVFWYQYHNLPGYSALVTYCSSIVSSVIISHTHPASLLVPGNSGSFKLSWRFYFIVPVVSHLAEGWRSGKCIFYINILFFFPDLSAPFYPFKWAWYAEELRRKSFGTWPETVPFLPLFLGFLKKSSSLMNSYGECKCFHPLLCYFGWL